MPVGKAHSNRNPVVGTAGNLHEPYVVSLNCIDYRTVVVPYVFDFILGSDDIPDPEIACGLKSIEEIPVPLGIDFTGKQVTDKLCKSETFGVAAAIRSRFADVFDRPAASVPALFPGLLEMLFCRGGPAWTLGMSVKVLGYVGFCRPVSAVKQFVLIDNGIEILC